MKKPMIKIHNATTGEEIEREMNAEEFAEYETERLQRLQEQEDKNIEAQKAVINKAAILAKLGITEDEAKLLLS
jgi:hypothetical protein